MSIQTGFSAVSIGPGLTQLYQGLGAVDRIYQIIDYTEVIEPSIDVNVYKIDETYNKL